MKVSVFKEKLKDAEGCLVIRKFDDRDNYERYMICLRYGDCQVEIPCNNYKERVEPILKAKFSKVPVLEYNLHAIMFKYGRLYNVAEFPYYEPCDSMINRLFMKD